MKRSIGITVTLMVSLVTGRLEAQILETKLNASDGKACFGRSVAISGNTAIVGAQGVDYGGDTDGRAYVFDVTAGTQLFKLTPSDGAGYFGNSVAISGDTAIVGAPGNSSAYLYNPVPIPEPSSVVLAVIACVGLLAYACRRFGGKKMTKSVAVLGVLVFGLCAVRRVNAQPITWSGNAHAYEFVVDNQIRWEDARAAAEAMTFDGVSGHLVTITSDEENGFVTTLISSSGSVEVWLGGHQPNPADPPAVGWVWVTGEPFVYTNWDPIDPEPNDAGGDEHLLGMWGPVSPHGPLGTWNDQSTDYGWIEFIGGYVVEYPVPIPEPSSVVLAAIGCLGPLAYAFRRRRRATRSAATLQVPRQ